MRRDDGVTEACTDFIDHADDTLDVRLVNTAQHIIKDQHGFRRAIACGKRHKRALAGGKCL